MATINRAGNPDDVKNSLQCGWQHVTIADINKAIADEKSNRNRVSVLKHLERALKNKQAGKSKF